MKVTLLLLFLFCVIQPLFSFAQQIEEIELDSASRYMVVANDTIPFVMSKVKRISYSKLELDSIIYFIDSLPCPSMYIIKGSILNNYDENCVKQGIWIEEVVDRKWKGNYVDGKKQGVWKTITNSDKSFFHIENDFLDDNLTLGNFFYPDGTMQRLVKWYYEDTYSIISVKEWYKNGNPKEEYKCKLNEDREYYLPLKVFEIDTAYEWFESGQLSYIAIHKGNQKNYKFFYENGNLQINTVCGVLGKNTRRITHYYENGNIKSINYFLKTKKDYNTKIGTWEFYDTDKKLIKKVIYKRGREKKTIYTDEL